jgi:hypothetical protein
MATVNVTVDSSVYVLLTAADSLIQNVSAYPLRVIFSASLPAVGVLNYHTLVAGDAILKSGGLPAGNIYARADIVGRDCKVVYSI